MDEGRATPTNSGSAAETKAANIYYSGARVSRSFLGSEVGKHRVGVGDLEGIRSAVLRDGSTLPESEWEVYIVNTR